MSISRRAFLSFSFAEPVRETPPWARGGGRKVDVSGPARVAELIEPSCLAHQGIVCTTCREHCPVSGAIEWVQMKPRIDEARCDGCGRCLYACPAPRPGVRLRFVD